MAKTSKLPLVLSLVAAAVAISLLVGIGFVVSLFFRGSTSGTDYASKVQMVESAPKSFAPGEVAKIGPYSVEASAQQGYSPTPAEAEAAQKVLDRRQRFDSINNYPDTYGYSLTEETGQYVLVTLHLTYDQERSVVEGLSTNSKDWMGQFGSMRLNTTAPLVVTPDVENYKASQEVVADTKKASGATVTLLYRVQKPVNTLTLNYVITIFTKVSPIVGTEGMPRKGYTYTIGIQ